MVQKLSATVKNFSTCARDGKTLPASVSMVMPRYFAVCEGTRSDFFSFIDPRIETGLPESESARAESGSDLKIATARGRTATKRMTASDALDCER